MFSCQLFSLQAPRRRYGRLVCIVAAVWVVLGANLQANQAAPPTESGVDALRVYLDCDRRACDFNYLRQEITFVNYVRDRRDAQVHVLVTRERTAAGGQAYTLDFFGLEEFLGQDDQLMFYTTQDDTDDAERSGCAQIFRLGLMRYVARTPLADRIEVSYQGVSGEQQVSAQPEDDPWNFWVFRVRANTEVEVEDLETSKEFGGSLTANRTTDAWKINLGVYADYDEDSFEFSDGRKLKDVSRNNAFTTRFIKTVGEHMGVGFGGSAVTTTFLNQDLTWRVAPAFQYNFFPYSESTRRELTVTYAIGFSDFNYNEITIFDKLGETRVDQSARLSLDTNQPWGDAGVSYEFSQFLDELSQSHQVVYGNVEYRLFRGFFLNISGALSRVRDQIYLKRGGVTDEQILLRRRELATDSEYRFRVGFTYAFGSIYNNVVNSRFDGASGGFIRAF